MLSASGADVIFWLWPKTQGAAKLAVAAFKNVLRVETNIVKRCYSILRRAAGRIRLRVALCQADLSSLRRGLLGLLSAIHGPTLRRFERCSFLGGLQYENRCNGVGVRFNCERGYHLMMVEKRVPNVYRQHALLDQVAALFLNIPGHLVVSEPAKSPDWFFALHRRDGKLVRRVLPAEGRMHSDAALIGVIRDRVTAMLDA